jgi:hypothetical protein
MVDDTLVWIDRDAREGPVFRIGPDVYTRERRDQRVLRLKAIQAPGVSYVAPAVEAFREVAAVWRAPIVFIIDPDVRKPPAVEFLYRWSEAAYANGSVDQAYMLAHNAFTFQLCRFVSRAFTDTMPCRAMRGEAAWDAHCRTLDLSCERPDFALKETSTALVHAGANTGAIGQLVRRVLRRGWSRAA